jgi:hypothetical protein
MAPKALDLFNAYSTGQLPQDGGYIVSSFLKETSAYSKYEIVGFSGVKNLYVTAEGMTFQSDGNKIFVLAELDDYAKKFIEPFRRDSDEQIPHRFSELHVVTTKNQARVMISAEPIVSYSAFTVIRPTGVNFSFLFFNRDDVFESIHTFFSKTLNQEAKIPRADAEKAADKILDSLDAFSLWESA